MHTKLSELDRLIERDQEEKRLEDQYIWVHVNHYYYTINKLAINANKTQLITISNKKMRKLADLVHLKALSYTILPKLQTKLVSS